MAILKPDKTFTLDNGLVIKEYLLTSHNTNKISMPAKRTASQPLIGVTLHNTDWINVASGTTPAEQYTRATYNGNMGDARVHWYVDDKCAWNNLGEEYTSWHAATGGQGQGNCNTISIECIMRNQTDAVSLASMENTAKLIAWLFDTHGWTIEKNLYTHNYWTNYKATGQCSADLDAQSLKKVSTTAKCFNSSSLANKNGKYCPLYLLPQWDKFKAIVKKYTGTSTATTQPSDTGAVEQPTSITTTPSATFAVGDVVQFTGGAVYSSANAATPAHSRDKSRCKITKTYNGKHPYHLISEDGAGVYGWVEAVDVAAIGGTTAQVVAGSKVKIKAGAKYYTGGTIPAWVASDTWIVSSLSGDRAVLGKNVSGKNNIQSPIKVSDLVLA